MDSGGRSATNLSRSVSGCPQSGGPAVSTVGPPLWQSLRQSADGGFYVVSASIPARLLGVYCHVRPRLSTPFITIIDNFSHLFARLHTHFTAESSATPAAVDRRTAGRTLPRFNRHPSSCGSPIDRVLAEFAER